MKIHNKKSGVVLSEIGKVFMSTRQPMLREKDTGIPKLSNTSAYGADKTKATPVHMYSDILEKWTDTDEITQDINNFLMTLFNESEQDYIIEDYIDAIETAIKEFRKITQL